MTRYTSIILLLLSTPLCAQIVHIPDPALRAAVRDALDLPARDSLTMTDMRKLGNFDARESQIEDLSGLEYATNLSELTLVHNNISDLTPIANLRLKELWLWDNQVGDLSPLAGMRSLTHLGLEHNRISDLSPLANLRLKELWMRDNQLGDLSPLAGMKSLTHLDLGHNRISDLSPLANLTNLERLELQSNWITDVTPLGSLTRLNLLAIEENSIKDHSALDGLSLEHFTYVGREVCDVPPLPLQKRLDNRTFPSAFSPWSNFFENLPHLSFVERLSLHDLYFCCLRFDGDFVETEEGVVIHNYMEEAIQKRNDYTAQNANMIFLAAFSWFITDLSTYPPDSPYWQRDADGEIVINYDAGTVDITHPDVQQAIIGKAIAIDKCGLYDGVFFDFWGEHAHSAENVDAMLTIVKGIRANTRENFLIMGNSNQHTAPITGSYLNGLYMEAGVPRNSYKDGGDEAIEVDLMQIETTLRWGAENLRLPQIIGLRGVFFDDDDEPLDSPRNLRWMRAMTTLMLTFSDGYIILVGDESVRGRYWYDFWDADLGRPVGPKFQLYDEDIPGLYIREYTNGWAVYNHSGAPQPVVFDSDVSGVASGWKDTHHVLPNLDGEMYLRIPVGIPGDINRDGVVNILDLTFVAQSFGTNDSAGDVNKDGAVNILDLVFVANQF